MKDGSNKILVGVGRKKGKKKEERRERRKKENTSWTNIARRSIRIMMIVDSSLAIIIIIILSLSLSLRESLILLNFYY